jgi:hypothetical protein
MKKPKYYYDTHYFKFMADGCKNYKEIVKALEYQTDFVKDLEKIGCKMSEPVDGGFLHLEIPVAKAKEYCEATGIKLVDLEEMNSPEED